MQELFFILAPSPLVCTPRTGAICTVEMITALVPSANLEGITVIITEHICKFIYLPKHRCETVEK